jgi:rhomboid protease GluP
MVKHGAMNAPLVLEGGQYYRLLTSIFMHFGINHIMNNMLILFILGDNLERALGHVKYLLFYLFCGIGSNIISMLVKMEDNWNVVSAGASGAIFGVVGGLLYAVAINRGRLEDLSTRQLVMVVVCTLYFGFTSSGVDNVAHVAGLLIGIVMGAVLYRRPKRVQI